MAPNCCRSHFPLGLSSTEGGSFLLAWQQLRAAEGQIQSESITAGVRGRGNSLCGYLGDKKARRNIYM